MESSRKQTSRVIGSSKKNSEQSQQMNTRQLIDEAVSITVEKRTFVVDHCYSAGIGNRQKLGYKSKPSSCRTALWSGTGNSW